MHHEKRRGGSLSFKELDFKELTFKELVVLGYLMGVPDCLLGVPDSYWASSAMDWEFPKRLFEETIRRRLFEGDYSKETIFGVAHTIFVGSGAHDICWEWRTRYLLVGVAHTIFLEWYLNLVPELGAGPPREATLPFR